MYMLDSSQPPTDAALAAARADGCVAWCGYVSSPGHPDSAWTRADFDRVRAHGLVPVFIDLGTSAGTIGAVLASYGAQPGDNVVTDIEPSGASLSNAGPWCAAVTQDGFRPWVYGLWSTVNAAPAGFAVKWGASYTGPDNVPVPRAGECVQYWNTHTEFGMAVDRSVVGVGVFDMLTLDMARLHVMGWYLALLHRVPTQAEVDFWATKLVAPGANFEAVLTEFYSEPEAAHDLADEQHEAAAIDAARG